MGSLTLEFLLWMLLAFFIGCTIGYLLHAGLTTSRNRGLAHSAAGNRPGPHSWVHSVIERSGTRAPPPPAVKEEAVVVVVETVEAVVVAPEPVAVVAVAPPVRVKAATGKPRPPQGLSAPPEGGGDSLQRISGIGPKIERTLNRLGVYRFEQIAGWTSDEADWVDEHLKFKGRIGREAWIAQARLLASGDDAAHARRFGSSATKARTSRR